MARRPMTWRMDAKIIAHSILWASLLIASTIMYRHTESYGTLFSIILACAVVSITILAAPVGKKSKATSQIST